MQFREFFTPPSFDPSILQNHVTLNPVLFGDDEKLHPLVREKLETIATQFLKSVGLPKKAAVRDIFIGGSNSNYNYGPESDVDLHIAIDTQTMYPGHEEAQKVTIALLRAKAVDWNKKRPITFHDVPVEIFMEDQNTPPVTGGSYSVLQNEWINPPRAVHYKTGPVDNKKEGRKLALEWAAKIKDAVKTGGEWIMRDCQREIRAQRSATLNAGDETSPENVAYKLLRAEGYFDWLFSEIDKAATKKHSIDKKQPLREFMAPTLVYHDTLNPLLWDENQHLKPEVRTKLLQIAEAFRTFVGLTKPVLDIRFKGSMANFNYKKGSDIDVHLIVDLNEKEERAINDKKAGWKARYDGINIYEFPVEVGVERPDRIHSSSAVYSLLHDQWIDRPIYAKPDTDMKRTRMLYTEWKIKLVAAIKSGDIKEIKAVEGLIRGTRDRVLKGSPDPAARRRMELSPENVAYKWLRDQFFVEMNKIYAEDRVGRLSLTKKNWLVRLLLPDASEQPNGS